MVPARALLLDLDGTLADSLPVMRRAYHALLAEWGVAGDDAEFDRMNGPPLAECARLLKQAHALAEPAETILTRWFAAISRQYLTVAPCPGARDLVCAAGQAGWRICVVTSSSEAVARGWLERVGLAGPIPHVVAGEHCRRGKPDPEPYLRALALTGADPALSVAVEDTATGARAALAAGIPTFVVGGGPVPDGARALPGLAALVPLVAGP